MLIDICGDIWQYILIENISIVSLYCADKRPVVERNGMMIMVDDHRFPLNPGERPQERRVRFRTLGCYPLTGAFPSNADNIADVAREILTIRTSERSERLMDQAQGAGMERNKREGYF